MRKKIIFKHGGSHFSSIKSYLIHFPEHASYFGINTKVSNKFGPLQHFPFNVISNYHKTYNPFWSFHQVRRGTPAASTHEMNK